MAQPELDQSDQGLRAGSGRPCHHILLTLAATQGELSKAVDRAVLTEEMVQHHAKQIDTATDELLLIEFQSNAQATHERRARMPDSGHGRLAVNRHDAIDLATGRFRIAIVVQREYFQQ